MMTRRLVAAVTFMVLVGSPAHASPIYDAASDFAAANPNGVWSYGWSTSLASTLNLYDSHDSPNGLDRLFSGSLGIDPNVTHNGTGAPVSSYFGVLYATGQLSFHPGSGDQFSHVRWTAPAAGSYLIDATFSSPLGYGTTTDVHVLLDGTAIFDGSVNTDGAGPSTSFLTTAWVAAGAEVDFAVGFGSDGSYGGDTTLLSAQISPAAVPEPASLLLLGAGLIGLRAWKKRKA